MMGKERKGKEKKRKQKKLGFYGVGHAELYRQMVIFDYFGRDG